jgi:hypothetical protein
VMFEADMEVASLVKNKIIATRSTEPLMMPVSDEFIQETG